MSLQGQPAGPLEPRTAGGCKQSLSWPQTLAHLSALGISTLPAIKKGQARVGEFGEGVVGFLIFYLSVYLLIYLAA